MAPKRFNPAFRVTPARRSPAAIQRRIEAQKSVTHNQHRVSSQKDLPTPPLPPDPLKGAGPGDRCPRPYCGGLLVLQMVVTVDGSCDAVVCMSCARSRVLAFREPYRPLRLSRDPVVETLLAPPKTPGSLSETDDTSGIVWPRSVADALRQAEDIGD